MSMEYWMNTFMDKVKDLLKGIDSDAWINTAIEKLKETQVTVTDIAKILMNKAEHVFPETRTEQIQQWINVAQKYAKPVSIALLIIILYRVFYGGGGGGKTMKAPGRNYRMSRSDFEGNPKDYFRGLRK